jgi:hypothetical protein
MKRFASILAVIPLSLALSGCLGDVMEIFCETGPDSDHCYQTAAVQESDPVDCLKVDFPPPRDKCHLMIAENTGDPTVCDGVEGGMMSYSPEECLEKAFRNHSVEDCVNAKDEAACRTAWQNNGKASCGDGYWFDKSKAACIKGEPPGSDDGIDEKAKEDLKTMGDAAKGKYMELLEKAIDGETDPGKLAGLQAYKEFLDKAGEKIESAQATWEKMEKLKKIFLDSYDPSMDIDRMPVDKILEQGLFDRIKDKIFGGGEQSPQQKEISAADDALSVYEAMLKRQGDIDYLKKDKLSRLKDEVVSALKDDLTSRITDPAKEIAEGIAGPALLAVKPIDYALTAFQEGAKKEAFLDLAKAYNRRRDDLAQKRPDLSSEELHNLTVAQVKDDPYQDNTNTGFVKFGNILENKDCQDESQPLCVDSRVWWTAMDKAYQFQHKKK